MVYHQAFEVIGQPNITVHDKGLASTIENPVTLISILCQVTAYAGNSVVGHYEREKILDLPDNLIDVSGTAATGFVAQSYNRILEIPVGMKIPPGQKFMIGISCGAAATGIRGAYRFQIGEE